MVRDDIAASLHMMYLMVIKENNPLFVQALGRKNGLMASLHKPRDANR